MNTIEEIKRRIQRVIDIEKGITRREREEFVEKREADGYGTTVRGLIIIITSLPGGYEEKSERRTS